MGAGGNRKVIRVADLSDADVAAIKAAKPRRCGAYTRQRGYRGEAEWCKFLNDYHIPTKRHFMSGMFEDGDCTTEPPCLPDRKLKGQVKRKKEIPAWLELEKHDYTAVREDRGEWFVVIRATLFRDLLQ